MLGEHQLDSFIPRSVGYAAIDVAGYVGSHNAAGRGFPTGRVTCACSPTRRQRRRCCYRGTPRTRTIVGSAALAPCWLLG